MKNKISRHDVICWMKTNGFCTRQGLSAKLNIFIALITINHNSIVVSTSLNIANLAEDRFISDANSTSMQRKGQSNQHEKASFASTANLLNELHLSAHLQSLVCSTTVLWTFEMNRDGGIKRESTDNNPVHATVNPILNLSLISHQLHAAMRLKIFLCRFEFLHF